MTTSILADHVGLVYKVRSKLRLKSSGPRLKPDDLRIGGSARMREVTALRDVSFSLSSGDRLGLVGSNGSGKTTLLKVLYGVYPPSSGAVQVNGRVDALFNIGLGFRPEATGRRNIELRGLINGWSADEIAERMEDIIEFSELGDFIDMPFKSYSQGMAARLAFSVATNLDPEILLMDEWIGAGDPPFQEKARERMNGLAERAGIIVLASHNHQLLKKTCNKVLMLDKGRVNYFFETIDEFDDYEEHRAQGQSVRMAVANVQKKSASA